MKVIKQGKAWTKRITCRGCNAGLEVEESDINYTVTSSDAERQQYEDDIEGTYHVDCPECGQNLTIKVSDIPKPMTDRIKDK